jgi:ribonuclease Z
MELTILGCGSALPTFKRAHSAQILRFDQENILIDCGEGTQMKIKQYGVKMQQISTILISHLHGDHYYGLAGVISTMHLLGRVSPLTVYGPKELEQLILLGLEISYTKLRFLLTFIPTNPKQGEVILDHKKFTITSFPLKHKIDTTGFVFREKPKPASMRGELIAFYEIPHYEINNIKAGADFVTEAGDLIKHETLTMPAPAPKSYAYCSDTRYYEAIVPWIKEVDVLYHEATFLDNLAQRAKETLHSTAKQAAAIASLAQAKQLILGHFSARYDDVSDFKNEALAVFDQVTLAEDGLMVKI